jgi:hypothetical protein
MNKEEPKEDEHDQDHDSGKLKGTKNQEPKEDEHDQDCE